MEDINFIQFSLFYLLVVILLTYLSFLFERIWKYILGTIREYNGFDSKDIERQMDLFYKTQNKRK